MRSSSLCSVGVSRPTAHESSSWYHECETNLCPYRSEPVRMSSSSLLFTHYRLAHKNDCLDKNLYPLLTHKHRVLTQKCAVCHVFIGRWGDIRALHKQRKLCVIIFIFLKADHVSRLSRWYTTNDQFAPSDPCLFCDKCFRMMHYDAQGNKLGEFLAYPYVDRGAFN